MPRREAGVLNRLSLAREARGQTQDEVARGLQELAAAQGQELRVDGNMVSRWERGVRRPHARYIRLLTKFFGKSAEELGLVQSIATVATAPTPDVQMANKSGRKLLSARQWNVAELVALGKTNREIAERLFISERTVEGHLAHILAKLSLRSRSQLAAWVSRVNQQPEEGMLSEVSRRAESEVKRKLARELHDSVAQILTLMVVDMEKFKLDQAGQQHVVQRVDSLQESTREVLSNLRELLYDLREEPSDDSSFVLSVRALLSSFESRTGIRWKLQVSGDWPAELSVATAHNLYRIVEEALNNVSLHSQAATVEVRLGAVGDVLELAVRDDGRGFPEGVRSPRQGLGMMGMRERAVLLGGGLHVGSNSSGGTTVRAIVPVGGVEAAESALAQRASEGGTTAEALAGADQSWNASRTSPLASITASAPEGPGGLVTFLRTDIEGQTRLWQSRGDELGAALDLHDGVLARAIERSGGRVERNEGDSFFAVFPRPTLAVAAAFEIQRELEALEWPAGLRPRVRIGIHTGEGGRLDPNRRADSRGLEANICGRLSDLAKGGQALLTLPTALFVRRELPPGAALRDRGWRVLRDVAEPQRIFELVVADGEVPTDGGVESMPLGIHTQDDVDRRLADLSRKIRTVSSNLHEFEEMREYRLLLGSGAEPGEHLTGETRFRVVPAFKAMRRLSLQLGDLEAMLERATRLRNAAGQLDAERVDELAGMLFGPSLELLNGDVPIEARRMDEDPKAYLRITPDDLLRALENAFEFARDVVLDVKRAQVRVQPHLDRAAAEAGALEAQARDLGADALANELAGVQPSIDLLLEQARRDPLGMAGDAERAFTPFLEETRSRLGELRRRRAEFAYDAFISYSHADRDWVLRVLLPRLEAEQLHVCVDQRDFQPGASWLVELERCVRQSRKTLVVLTPAYVNNEWTQLEHVLAQAIDPQGSGRRVLPLLAEACELPPRLSALTCLDLTGEAEIGTQVARLVAAIRSGGSDTGPTAVVQPRRRTAREKESTGSAPELLAPIGSSIEVVGHPRGASRGSGAAALMELTESPLDGSRLEAAVAHPGAGAVCTLTGLVRDNSHGEPLSHLEYEAYPGMAETQMNYIAEEIVGRWPGARVAMAHRTGRLEIGETSVVISVACADRAAALEACGWGIERLEESLPIWKKEFVRSGAFRISGSGSTKSSSPSWHSVRDG